MAGGCTLRSAKAAIKWPKVLNQRSFAFLTSGHQNGAAEGDSSDHRSSSGAFDLRRDERPACFPRYELLSRPRQTFLWWNELQNLHACFSGVGSPTSAQSFL